MDRSDADASASPDIVAHGPVPSPPPLLAQLLERAPDGVAVVQDGRIVFSNPALARLLFKDAQGAQPLLADCVHADDLPPLLQCCASPVLDTPLPRRLILRPVHAPEQLEATISAMDWHGRPAALLFVRALEDRQCTSAEARISAVPSHDEALQQLTQELSRTRDALRLSELQYQELFENAPVGIFLSDSSDRALHVNPEMARMVGAASAQEGVQHFQRISRQLYVDPSRRQELLRQLQEHGQVAGFEFEAERLDGQHVWISLCARLRDRRPDGSFKLDGFATDVTARKRVELEVAESESRYRALFQDNSVVMLLVEPETGALLDVNKAACAFYGWTRDEMLRMHIFQINTATPEAIQREMSAALCRGKRYFSFHHRLASGEVRDVEVYSGPIVIRGKPLLYSCVVDVTERIRVEAALRKSQQHLRHVADTVPGVLYQIRLDGDGGVSFPYLSDRARMLLGIHPADVMRNAQALLGRIHPDDMAEIQARTQDSSRHLTPFSSMHRFLRGDGALRWVRTESIPQRLEDGSTQWTGIVMDITDAMLAEQALQQSRARLLETQQIARLGHFEYDTVTEASSWSAETLRLLDAPSDVPPDAPVPGLDILLSRLAFSEERQQLEHDLAALQKGDLPTPLHRDLRLRSAAGCDAPCGAPCEHRSLRLIAHMEPDLHGAPTLLRGVLQDVTDQTCIMDELRRLTREAETANRVKSEFLANMSHEIRTPLNGVMGMLQLLLQGDATPEQREHAQAALNSTLRLTSLLSDILDLSALESGKLRVTVAPFRLADVLDSIPSVFNMTARDRGLRLQVEVSPQTPAVLEGDAHRLRQILINLVGNALKFTDAGEVTLTVHPLAGPHLSRSHVLFSVLDTGRGIAAENLACVFDPFFQEKQHANSSAQVLRQPQGVGLGLAIVRQLVELMGGCMCVDSDIHRGSAFYVSLPLRALPAKSLPGAGLADASTPASTSALARPEAALKDARILIVEDEKINRLALRRVLERAGVQVREAENGWQALTILTTEVFDLVLMDIQMPTMNGEEATVAIRSGQAGPAAQRLPIVALTAYAMAEDRERFLAAGMDHYLPKPVEFDVLIHTLAGILAGDSARPSP